MSHHLLIVDGHNLLFQMFFGMPARICNREGGPIQGIVGFIGALRNILQMTAPTHILVLFDREQENSRAKLDPQYKSTRPDFSSLPEEDCPFSQLPDIYTVLDMLHITHFEADGAEADDAIACYVRAYGAEGQVTIASFDSDFFQLITPNVRVLRYRGKRQTVICDEAYLQDRYAITPAQYVDFKALTGDTADHIPGADHVGPKTAAYLLSVWQTLDNLLTHADQIPNRSCGRQLRQSDRLRLNQQLIRLNDRAVIPLALDTLVYTGFPFTTGEILSRAGIQ